MESLSNILGGLLLWLASALGLGNDRSGRRFRHDGLVLNVKVAPAIPAKLEIQTLHDRDDRADRDAYVTLTAALLVSDQGEALLAAGSQAVGGAKDLQRDFGPQLFSGGLGR